MNKLLCTLALGVFLAAPSFARQSLNVTATGDKNEVTLSYLTIRQFSSMCHMQTTRVEIVAGVQKPNDEPGPKSIEIEAEVNPQHPCLTAFGSHRGGVTLTRGNELPSLPDGEYDVTINGEEYGTLVVSRTKPKLVP